RQWSARDPLEERALEQMVLGVSTRRYARSLEPLPAGIAARGVSKSAVSERFVYGTERKLAERKCCNFQNGDGGRPERNWAARFQAARSNSLSMNRFCLRTSSSLTHRACPLRIMCIASYPSIARRAARNSRKLCLAFTRRLIARWSCSRMLFKYWTGRCRQRRRRVPSSFTAVIAEP